MTTVKITDPKSLYFGQEFEGGELMRLKSGRNWGVQAYGKVDHILSEISAPKPVVPQKRLFVPQESIPALGDYGFFYR